MKLKNMSSLDLSGKRVLIREDLNVPVKDGVVTSDARIRAALPTIEAALAAKARVLVMSHLGRPEEGKFDPAESLADHYVVMSRGEVVKLGKGADMQADNVKALLSV